MSFSGTINLKGLKILERRIQAIRLRKEGYSYQEIGDILGVSTVTAHNDIKKALESNYFALEESANEVREMILARDHDAIKAIYEKVHNGDLGAIDRLIKLNEQLLSLVGGSTLRHDLTSGGKPLVAAIHTIEVVLSNDGLTGKEDSEESA